MLTLETSDSGLVSWPMHPPMVDLIRKSLPQIGCGKSWFKTTAFISQKLLQNTLLQNP